MNFIITTLTVTSVAVALFSFSSQADTAVTQLVEQKESEQNLTDKQRLIDKLRQISQFTADFNQQVIAEDGTELMPSEGKLAVQKPNLVFWHTISPDETTIVSDGSTLWFFDPFVEQVTAYSVNDSIANTPILLLTSSNKAQWENYQVEQTSADTFAISSLQADSRITTLDLTFSPQSAQLSSFAFTDATGQKSIITLKQVDTQTEIPANTFVFAVPEGIYVDDQR